MKTSCEQRHRDAGEVREDTNRKTLTAIQDPHKVGFVSELPVSSPATGPAIAAKEGADRPRGISHAPVATGSVPPPRPRL